MPTAHDVANYILSRLSKIPSLKLNKLVYYAQAWHLVFEDVPLFEDPIEAWEIGPIVVSLYEAYAGKFEAEPTGEPNALTKGETSTVDVVIASYGNKRSQWLSDLCRMEEPWRDARLGLGSSERGGRVISHQAMKEYYGSL